MTTIAYKDGMLAADTAVTFNDTVAAATPKIARAPDGSIGGACGDLSAMLEYCAWIEAGAEGNPPPVESGGSFEAILIRPNGGLVWRGEGSGPLRSLGLVENRFMAIGSGFAVATGAMAAGASAAEAVAIAMRLDAGSGGEVQTLMLASARLGTAPKEPRRPAWSGTDLHPWPPEIPSPPRREQPRRVFALGEADPALVDPPPPAPDLPQAKEPALGWKTNVIQHELDAFGRSSPSIRIPAQFAGAVVDRFWGANESQNWQLETFLLDNLDCGYREARTLANGIYKCWLRPQNTPKEAAA